MEQKRIYLQKEFESFIESSIDQPTAGLVSDVRDKCKGVTAINKFNIFFNQGMEGNCVVPCDLNGLKTILPNLALFENLKQFVVSECVTYPYMEFWPVSLEQVTLRDSFDLSGLNHLPNLRDLALCYPNADLAAIRPIAGQLTSLAFNSAKDDQEIENFVNLELLTYGTQEGSLTPFANLPNLRRLFIEDYERPDLNGLEKCKALEALRIQCGSDNTLANIAAIANLSKLREVTFVGSSIMDITPLSGLKLEKLSISWAPLLDFSPLGKIATLKELDLGSCMIDDLSVLEGLENLEVLTLTAKYISDFSPLLELPKLREVRGCDSRKFPKELREKLGLPEPQCQPRIEYNGFETKVCSMD